MPLPSYITPKSSCRLLPDSSLVVSEDPTIQLHKPHSDPAPAATTAKQPSPTRAEVRRSGEGARHYFLRNSYSKQQRTVSVEQKREHCNRLDVLPWCYDCVLEVTEPKEQQDQKNCRVSWPCPPNAGVLSGKPATLVHWLSLGWNLLEDVSFRRGSAHLPTDVAHSSPQVLSSSNAMNRRMQ